MTFASSSNDIADEQGSPTRRRFLGLLVAAGAAVGLTNRSVLSAIATTNSANPAVVWRLDSHWGYPVGPRQKTHCQCTACKQHSTNKVFATREAAEAGRAHLHCVCEARAVQIDPVGYNQIFSGASSVDMRHAGIAALYQQFLVSSH